MQPNVDARIFEIVSFAILKAHYGEQAIYWGWPTYELKQDFLVLYKTGRTNANDGGIDFVMKPPGGSFKSPKPLTSINTSWTLTKSIVSLTFVVKSTESEAAIRTQLRVVAHRKVRG
ncbi:MAG: hypothetical protein U0641_12105 [Anaerolineae bacterium]